MPARERKGCGGVALHKHAVPVVAKEERQWKIGVLTLMRKLFDDGAFRRFAHAVHAVKTLAHAIGDGRRAIVGKHAYTVYGALKQVLNLRVLMIV